MCPSQESLLFLDFLPLVIRNELVLNRNYSYFTPWITDDYRIVLASIYFKLSNGQPPCCCTEFHLHCCLFSMFSFQSIFPVQLFLLLLYVRTSCHIWESPNVCLPESSSIWVSPTSPKIDTPPLTHLHTSMLVTPWSMLICLFAGQWEVHHHFFKNTVILSYYMKE